jgi:hypothetical protein
MAIIIDEPQAPGIPVVKRQALGETIVGAIVDQKSRDIKKLVDGVLQSVLKPNGKARQEMVLTAVAMPGTTMTAGIGDTTAPVTPGDMVRIILRGKSFADWLDAKKGLGRGVQVGDVVSQTTDHGQAYDANGSIEGPKLTTKAQIDAVPRAKTLGIYGPITLRPPATSEAEWVVKAEAAWHQLKKAAEPIGIEEDPF